MNKKGFTLVELITTFALAAVIIAILINIVLIIKDIYVKYEIKTEMLIKQGELNSVINEKVINGVTEFSNCNDSAYCYTFTTGEEEYKLQIVDNTITFGDYVYKAGPNVTIGTPTLSTTDLPLKYLYVPIKHKLYSEDDFGLRIVLIN